MLVNYNFLSLCYVVYTKKLLNYILKDINNDKIDILNKMIVFKSIQSECAPFLIDDEMIQIAECFQ